MARSWSFAAAGSARSTMSFAAPWASKDRKVPVGACVAQDADVAFAGGEDRTIDAGVLCGTSAAASLGGLPWGGAVSLFNEFDMSFRAPSKAEIFWFKTAASLPDAPASRLFATAKFC